MDKKEEIDLEACVLLGFIISLVGYLAYKYTGEGAGKISPQFWVGMSVPLLTQLIRKKFDLKKPGN